jgi:hypothetical protein
VNPYNHTPVRFIPRDPYRGWYTETQRTVARLMLARYPDTLELAK